MLRRLFCKIALIAVVVCALLALSGVLLAQGRSEEALERVIEIQERNTERLMAIEGVVGTAVGLNPGGQLAVAVLLERPGVGGIPQQLEGVPVHPIVTGAIYALPRPEGKGKPGGGGGAAVDPTARFPRPVPIGVSTGHPAITAGTIGCRVTDGSNVYALSNNHVYANSNDASIGDLALQPGPYDGGTSADAIGTLAVFESIKFDGSNNYIDAAIALSSKGNLGTATPSDGYGTPSSTPQQTVLPDLAVQKYGRTTGLTQGKVGAINATVDVCYASVGPWCTKLARFVGQIVITPGTFSDGGDSGSLIVTNDENKNPVGLLFAGSATHTIANPIGAVLTRFGVSIDDGAGAAPPPTTTGFISGEVTSSSGGAIGGASVTTDTGQSTTTGPNGTYTLSNVPTGDRSVTASAAGFQSQTTSASVAEDQTATVDFSLNPVTTATNVFVVLPSGTDGYATSGGKDGKKQLNVTVALVDDLDAPVGGASVSVRLNNTTTGGLWTATGTTGTNGTVTFTLSNAPPGTYKTTVTAVVAAGLTWDGSFPPNSFTK